MIRITNYFDSAKYELVPREDTGRCSCCGCAFYNRDKKRCYVTSYWMEFNHQLVCKSFESNHPEWGEPETLHYVIKLGERVELVDCK